MFVIVAMLACHLAFRRYVIPRIVAIFENVPPFNVVTGIPHPYDEPLLFFTADGVILRKSSQRTPKRCEGSRPVPARTTRESLDGKATVRL